MADGAAPLRRLVHPGCLESTAHDARDLERRPLRQLLRATARALLRRARGIGRA